MTQCGARADQHFVAQGLKGAQAFLFPTLAQGVQKPQHGRGHAQFARNGQADDAVGMEGGGKGNAIFSVLGYGPVDQGQELVIPPVEVQ